MRKSLYVLFLVSLLSLLLTCKPRGASSSFKGAKDVSGEKDLLLQDQETPFDKPSDLESASPLLAKTLRGDSLSSDEKSTLLAAVRQTFTDCRFTGINTKLLKNARKGIRDVAVKVFQQELANFPDKGQFSRVAAEPSSSRWAEFASLVQQLDCAGVSLSEIWSEHVSPRKKFFFVSADEVSGMEEFIKTIAWSPNAQSVPDDDAKFLRTFAASYDFIDFYDMLANMTPRDSGRKLVWPQQDKPIWNLYDVEGMSMLDRWWSAYKMGVQKQTPAVKDSYAIISQRGNSFAFRGKRVVGGGDLSPATNAKCSSTFTTTPDKKANWPLTKSWLDNTKFFRVTARQRLAIEHNPLLVSKFCDDPNPDPNRKTYLGQYEYPSARTYEKVSFALSPKLLSDLKAAEAAGNLDNQDNDVFSNLTARMIDELINYVLKDWSKVAKTNPSSVAYQLLISIHPSDDFNGRSLRMWFKFHESQRTPQAEPAGVPLFLTNFDMDIYGSPEEFFEQTIVGARQWGRLLAALTTERTKGNRKYYNISLPWMVAADIEEISADKVWPFVQKAQQWFNRSDRLDLIRQKRNDEVYWLMQKELVPTI